MITKIYKLLRVKIFECLNITYKLCNEFKYPSYQKNFINKKQLFIFKKNYLLGEIV